MKIHRQTLLAAAILGSLAATSASALTINLINTGGVEDGTAAYTGFRAAANYWESMFSDNVTLTFNVGFTSVGFASTTLGSTSSASSSKTTAAWKTALTADATTALDASVVANLPNFSSTTVVLNNTVEKALGLYTGLPTTIDATIKFNSARPFDFDTRNGFATVSSDFVAVAVHEMGHALGFTSAVGTNTTLNSRPTNIDMFRYKDGAWNNTYGGKPYFSIDGGATEFEGNAGFSAGPDGYQTSHWREGARIHDGVHCTVLLEPQVGILDPTGGLCQEGIVTSQDLAIFDAMGWNLTTNILANPNYQMKSSQILQNYLNTVPEPSTWALLIAGFGFVGAAMRRRVATAVTA
ncbi:NF038122 family metalloprotease [Polymorphobacter sp. PAMC 29334]|uniref:NF038122 family metalloprotease n=1 Tax=Polymorphobacter sp. PAMC 29334 TaxID=2862331 RepID=UPI001C74B36A|nr:NF038122 family metalloprotease [Polymorphobacter sp. PAMC 29334]QYE36114.1 NF038122 family metalloprotease [Polymorphobacter sp. PAMC 29334]